MITIGIPHKFVSKMEYRKSKSKAMTFIEAVRYLNKHSTEAHPYEGWTIRYYGFGEHLTFWRGDGTFLDFGIDADMNISWSKMQEVIIESAIWLKELHDTDRATQKRWSKMGKKA